MYHYGLSLFGFYTLHMFHIPKCGSLKLRAAEIANVLSGIVPAFSSNVPFKLYKHSGDGLGHACACDDENDDGDG